MTRYVTLSNVILLIGIALLIAPILFPVQPVLYHDTSPGTMANETVLEDDGYAIIAYENLSERGQEHYVKALRNDGEHIVPQDNGAQEFSYATVAELGNVENRWERMTLESVIIERPPNASLPPADEPVEDAEHRWDNLRRPNEPTGGDSGESTPANEREPENGPTVEELRERTARYDQMTTRTDLPPLFAPLSLLRLLSMTFGVTAISIGGFLRSKP